MKKVKLNDSIFLNSLNSPIQNPRVSFNSVNTDWKIDLKNTNLHVGLP